VRRRISVVIPSFNHARYVEDALRSALEQSRTPDEVVVVDDGSTDGSVEILRSLEKRGVKVVAQGNQGAHADLNRGIELAGGDLLFILNSDDRYDAWRVERIAARFEADSSIRLSGSWIRLIDGAGRGLGVKKAWANMHPWPCPRPDRSFLATSDARWNLLQGNYLATSSNLAFSRELWRSDGPFLPLRFAHDWDFALTAALHSSPDVVEEPLLDYRIHDDNTIRKDPREMELEVLWVLARHLPAFAAQETAGDPGRAREFLERLAESVHTFDRDRLFLEVLALASTGRADPLSPFFHLLESDSPLRRWLLHRLSS
jgi:glycosyltransferase involved in cell wall biosynthesis